MATFVMRGPIQYLDGSGTPGFDNDGEPLFEPTSGDYSADMPSGVGVKHMLSRVVGTVVGITRLYNPSPFTLIREVDANIFPATSNGFDQGFN